MTYLFVLATLGLLLLPAPQPASGNTYAACWVEERPDPFGTTRQVTVCRLANGSTAEHAGETPPGPIEPLVGTDATGMCWYWTSRDTEWVILSTFTDGSAILGVYNNTVLVLDSGRIPRCTSEPVESGPPLEAAREAITEYVHDPPLPDLNPPTGRGLAGLETFVGLPVPGPWSDTISVPGYTLDVEVVVEAVTVEWGDGNTSTYPPSAYSLLIGYPDGVVTHTYEVKTCASPGSAPDCHPGLMAYPITVSYVWQATWRVNGGPWVELPVPAGSTTVDYPVAESEAVLTETG